MVASSLYKKYIPSIAPQGLEKSVAWMFVFNPMQLLIKKSEQSLSIPTSEELSKANLTVLTKQYLGELEGRPCYCVEIDGPGTLPEGLEFSDLRSLLGQVEEELFLLAGRAFQIMNWNRMNKYCGKCGALTQSEINERAKKCPACGSVFYPRISPAIIVAVRRGDEILLAHNKNFRPNWYSVLAGFVEPGETFEDCVIREVMEEVRIRVKNITYFDSQPWPFPDSLMVGFVAEYESGEIIVDGEEIDDAAWYRIDKLPPCPMTTTIAGRLIKFALSK